MTEQIKDRLTRWSLERVKFLLSHIENFVEDGDLRERALQFVSQTGLDKIESLLDGSPTDPNLPMRILDRLAPFFEAGLLLKRAPSSERESWWVTDLVWRGMVFHLELPDQVEAKGLVPELTPLQVHRAAAEKILSTLNLPFLLKNPQAQGYLLKPTPTVAFVFFTPLADHWAEGHLTEAQRLINKCFIY